MGMGTCLLRFVVCLFFLKRIIMIDYNANNKINWKKEQDKQRKNKAKNPGIKFTNAVYTSGVSIRIIIIYHKFL